MPHEGNPLWLHSGMFLDFMKKQTTEEQKAKWLPLAESYKLVGTYAQTELGHGKYLNISASVLSKLLRFVYSSENFEEKGMKYVLINNL